MKPILLIVTILFAGHCFAQHPGILKGQVYAGEAAVPYASVSLQGTDQGTLSDSLGHYTLSGIPAGNYIVSVMAIGYSEKTQAVSIVAEGTATLDFQLQANTSDLNEVVVTGTLKEVSRSKSPVPVEVYTSAFFRKNPTPSLFDALGMINGVQSQINCNVCNTGDIHINGMNGPYTMILIDGMPIVSSLSSVYGLSGIPNSLVDRVEVVKGPASSLYGSEAMGGTINVITKNPTHAPVFSADLYGTTWQEYNADVSVKFKIEKLQSLLGVNYFNYQHPVDNNHDGFADVTLQNRISLFNKWSLSRKENRIASLAARYVYEDRWGGQMNWNSSWRGSDSIYGESIYTSRLELIGMYQLPVQERIITQFSFNNHDQNSFYGYTPYRANQKVLFGQVYWDKYFGQRKQHNFLLGASMRYTYYDDNTPGTATIQQDNQPMKTPLPGIFVQDEWTIDAKNTLLAGYRYDYDKHHGSIHSPRLAYKFAANNIHTIRISLGTGYRVVNLFNEDHAALTGARQVIIAEELHPERSYNGNLNYILKIPFDAGFLNIDATGFYSYFTNKIVGDFDTDPNKIIYDNLRGHAISQGISLNADANFTFPLRVMAGITYMDVYETEEDARGRQQKKQQLFAPAWSGTFLLSYTLPKGFSVDVTGKYYGPMRLPVQPADYRAAYSPWYCLANIQVTWKSKCNMEIYGGVKNILNYVPHDSPLMRSFDPFDKRANDPVANPNGYTFDTEYNYAPLQGIKGFLGFRYRL